MQMTRLQDTGWKNFELMPHGQPTGATVHRTRPSDHGFADTAVGLRDLYRDQKECKQVAKASTPFHIVIEPSGRTTQMAPLNAKLWHAYQLNATHLGIVCIGDFREHSMPAAQRAALVGVCAGLSQQSQGRIPPSNILGHTERPEGSRNPDWDSPGKLFSMGELRQDVATSTLSARRAIISDFAWDATAFEN